MIFFLILYFHVLILMFCELIISFLFILSRNNDFDKILNFKLKFVLIKYNFNL